MVEVGPAILVSSMPTDQSIPSVAIDNQGDFVVAWTQNQPNGNPEILAQKFGPAGNAVGGNVPVAVGTFHQTQPHVAMDAKGDFVVSYTRDTNNNNPDIFAKLYNVNEQPGNVVSVATTPSAETNSSVAMTPDGRFDVAYESALSANFHDIVLNQYSAQGGLLDARTIFAPTSGSAAEASNPSVSVDNLGNAVVAWQQDLPSDFNVFRMTSGGQRKPGARTQHRHHHHLPRPEPVHGPGARDGATAWWPTTRHQPPRVPQVQVAEVTQSRSTDRVAPDQHDHDLHRGTEFPARR